MNRFSKLIKTLKEAPTNSMGGVYSLNEPGFRVGIPDAPEKIYPDIDGNFTDGIPGNPGDPFYLRPEGYWNGGNNWTETEIPDASQEYLINDPTGKSTSDLIAEDGTVKTAMPPDSRSFILGPLVDGYVYNHGYDNYSNIGYIQKDTRQFVLLARIQGQFIEGLHPQGGRVWDGTADQLTIYNSNFTLAMAEWFRDQLTANSFTENVPYFYSGGVPQQPQTPAECPNCPPNMFGGVTPGTNGGFGRGTNPTLGTQQGTSTSGNQLQANIFNLTPDQQRTLMNATMLGLDIVAVLAVLFPEPSSSAAGAVHLATKFRYIAKLRRFRGALNPFGQRAVRSGAAGRVRRQVYSGRPYQGKRGFGKTTYGTTNRATARTYSNPGPLKGTPGTGSRVNPRGTVDTGTLPQRYIDKYGSRSVLGQKQVKLGPKAAKRTFGEQPEFILEQINNYLLLETAATGSGLGGGTEVADAYVDKVSETSSPEELEKASNDANDIATEGGKGLSDSDLAKIDQEAEAEARRLTDIDINNPESMDADQLISSTNLMFEIDPDWTLESFNRNEYLIDGVKLDKLYDEYTERRNYIGSLEYSLEIDPEFRRYYNQAEYLHDTYVSQITFVDGYYNSDGRQVPYVYIVNKNTGERIGSGDLLDKKLSEWSDLYTKTWDTFNRNIKTIFGRRDKDRQELLDNYRKQSNILFRPFLLQVVREWSQRDTDINDDPYSLENLTPGEIANMSEADKKKLKSYLSKMGVSYGDIAYAAAGDGITGGLAELIIGGGIAVIGALGSLYNMTNDQVQNIYKSYNQPGIGDAVRKGDAREAGQSEAEKQEKAEAAQELEDATAELEAAEASGNQDRIERAAERRTNAVKNKQRANAKWKNQRNLPGYKGESYEPRFLKNRERKNLTETRTPKQKRILREIKQPIKVKEAPTKYKMNFEGKYSAQNTPDKTSSAQSDALVASGNAKGQKWRQQDKYWSGYETTERMNIIHDRVGHGKQAWDMILDEAKKKNGWRDKEMQEELNKIAHERAMLKENPDYTSPFGNVEVSTTEKNDDNFNKVSKKIKQIVSKDKEVKPEYPEENKMDKMKKLSDMVKKIDKDKKEYEHEKLNSGENAAARYKRLDPISADSMPDAAYPQIDQLRNQARKKAK